MNDDYQIVTDRSKLSKACKKVAVPEGIEIGKILLRELKKERTGIGLAANQIGLTAAVCVVKIGKPVVLVNPVIKNAFKKIFPLEACLSFPGEQVTTQRWANIAVKADNHKDLLYFGEDNLLECICIQHEIDHLNGITMFERQNKLDKPANVEYIKNIK